MSEAEQTTGQRQRPRRNVTLDPELNEWLSNDVDNASALVRDLLRAYRAYGDAMEAVKYVEERTEQRAAQRA